VPNYTSLDIAPLPCEFGSEDRHFFPLEFDEKADVRYTNQLVDLLTRLKDPEKPIKDLVVFSHGWNKNPTSAEADYQNFLCRLTSSSKNADVSGMLIVGIFWPSTITGAVKDPWLLKPISYFRMRNRADRISAEGAAEVLTSLVNVLSNNTDASKGMRLHVLGHSFGGRIIVNALRKIDEENDHFERLLSLTSYTRVLLINAALSSERFSWLAERMENILGIYRASDFQKKENSIKSSTESVSPVTIDPSKIEWPVISIGQSSVINLHSFNDSANKIAYPIASIFTSDTAECAVGACGVKNVPTACVDSSGELLEKSDSDGIELERLSLNFDINFFNVDGTNIISSHSDIYKGRVANVISNLLFRSSEEVFVSSETCKN